MSIARPEDLFDREFEWSDLVDFATAAVPGLRIGIVSGRRRQGKSYLLRRLARSSGAFYHQAQEVGRQQALTQFADEIGLSMGLGAGRLHFPDWEAAFRTALGHPDAGSTVVSPTSPSGPGRIVMIDELPYLLAHSPEIPSVLQKLYDESHDLPGSPPSAVILCGSALSVMSDLLSGAKALRGRAQLNLTLRPFDYRVAARYWGFTNPALAFQTDAIVGGTPGYKALVTQTPPTALEALPVWLGRSVLNPSHALFQETDHLLREDPRITDRALYNSILSAVASGQHTIAGLGGVVGRDHNSLRHPLQVLETAGFLTKVEDVLTRKRPLYYIADPIIRFAQVVVEPYRALLEERDVDTVWAKAAPAFTTGVLGPHFEHLASTWTSRYSGDRWGQDLGRVGPAVIKDPANRSQHQIDVLGLASTSTRVDDEAQVVVIGEAKSTKKARTIADLDRLEHIRSLLEIRGLDVTQARLALFSREGFDESLISAAAKRPDVHLIDLGILYDLPSST